MQKLKQITLEDFIQKNHSRFGQYALVPKAWIKKSAEYFEKNFNLEFWDTYDNLDYVKLAFLSLSDDTIFQLSYYRRNPVPNVTIIEMVDNYAKEQLDAIVKALIAAYKLDADEIVIL